MGEPELNVVTGGLSYIGKHITQRILSKGNRVSILTGHPDRPNPFGNQVKIAPFNFGDEDELIKTLHGAATLYNTYWVRFDYGTVSFDQAVRNTERLIEAAGKAGIRKIVHISVSNPSEKSSFPYYRGKAVLERLVIASRIPYVIIRPTLVFGGKDEILVNNIAWLLRRFPVFAMPGKGDYRLQPIHVEDLVNIAVNTAHQLQNKIIDAAGPDILTFEEMVRLIARKIRSRAFIFHLNADLSLLLLKVVGILINDVVLTRDELGALKEEYLTSKDPAAGRIRFGDWLEQTADHLGQRYASELNRHYRKT